MSTAEPAKEEASPCAVLLGCGCLGLLVAVAPALVWLFCAANSGGDAGEGGGGLGLAAGCLVLLLAAPAYFAPALVARVNGHPDAGLVFILNAFLAPTLLGWAALLWWARHPEKHL